MRISLCENPPTIFAVMSKVRGFESRQRRLVLLTMLPSSLDIECFRRAAPTICSEHHTTGSPHADNAL